MMIPFKISTNRWKLTPIPFESWISPKRMGLAFRWLTALVIGNILLLQPAKAQGLIMLMDPAIFGQLLLIGHS